MKAEDLNVLAERMKALCPKQNENDKFLECEQAEQIDTDAVYKSESRNGQENKSININGTI